jgi:hypothetical protein
MLRGRALLRIAAALVPLALGLSPVPASAASPEARVKAAYLFKLAAFVRWPNEVARRAEFKLCVAGSKEVAGALRDLTRGERVLGSPVTVSTIDPDRAGDVRNCQIAFVGRGRDAARTVWAAAGSLPILTVADRSGGTDGGVIDFVVRDGKVRFVINRTLARRQRLELSSKLLDIALAVEP